MSMSIECGYVGNKFEHSLDFQFVLCDAHQFSGRSGGGQACDCGEFGVVYLWLCFETLPLWMKKGVVLASGLPDLL